jgi:hypothetical protein
MAIVSAMSTMTTVHEHVQKRTGEQEQPKRSTENVGAVFAP